MKKLLPLFLALSWTSFLFSQNVVLSPISLNAGGGDIPLTGNFAWSYSIGESVIATLATDEQVLSQGFQQPETVKIIISVKNISPHLLGWSADPNPAYDKIILKPEHPITKETQVSVWNQFGQQVFPTLHLQTGKDQYILNVSALATGVYFIKIKNHAGQEGTFKIIKIRT